MIFKRKRKNSPIKTWYDEPHAEWGVYGVTNLDWCRYVRATIGGPVINLGDGSYIESVVKVERAMIEHSRFLLDEQRREAEEEFKHQIEQQRYYYDLRRITIEAIWKEATESSD